MPPNHDEIKSGGSRAGDASAMRAVAMLAARDADVFDSLDAQIDTILGLFDGLAPDLERPREDARTGGLARMRERLSWLEDLRAEAFRLREARNRG